MTLLDPSVRAIESEDAEIRIPVEEFTAPPIEVEPMLHRVMAWRRDQISHDEVLEVVERYRYSETLNPKLGQLCVYTHPDGRHCLVGQILSDLGLPLPVSGSEEDTTGFNSLGHNYPQLSNDSKMLLERLQRLADNSMSWGNAIQLRVVVSQ